MKFIVTQYYDGYKLPVREIADAVFFPELMEWTVKGTGNRRQDYERRSVIKCSDGRAEGSKPLAYQEIVQYSDWLLLDEENPWAYAKVELVHGMRVVDHLCLLYVKEDEHGFVLDFLHNKPILPFTSPFAVMNSLGCVFLTEKPKARVKQKHLILDDII